MTSPGGDLYAVLGVARSASLQAVRDAYAARLAEQLTVAQRDTVRDAFAVLGDPRLRAEYDAGRVVGVGAGHYYVPGEPAPRPLVATSRALAGLDARWQARWEAEPRPAPDRVTYSSVARPFYWWLLGVVCGAGGLAAVGVALDLPAR